MINRREWLAMSALAPLSASGLMTNDLPACSDGKPDGAKRRPKVAAVFTEFRFRAHAYNILENFFKPYYFRGELIDPGVDVVSFYADQFPRKEMARTVAGRFGIPLYKTIRDAVCRGGKNLAVDAVLSIGEHGNYPYNKLGQKMYPRKRFFDEIVAPMKEANRFVPIFNDKHLSYRWDWAKEMYDVARKFRIPFMAGSSVPLAQRIPSIHLPNGAEFEEAVSIHGGGFESYDFHGLELLQSFVESRKGGETGLAKVELLTGDALTHAIKSGRISKQLIDAAMQAETNARMQRRPFPSLGKAKRKSEKPAALPHFKRPAGPHALALTYRDGFRAAVLKVGNSSNRWNFACRLKGKKKPLSTALYNGPWGNRCLFKALSHSIQFLFRSGKQPYPLERTLLVTGTLAAAVRSFNENNKPIATPHLAIAYQPIDFRNKRENGASWRKITVNTPQPIEFTPGDKTLKHKTR